MTTTAASAEKLRGRKRHKTRRALQTAALQLFSSNGYAETTIEQIAAVVDVSPRTFFRYFPTKEAVLTTDLLDEAVAQELATAPAELSIIDAYHCAVTNAFSQLTDDEWRLEQMRMRLVVITPGLGPHALADLAARPIDDAAEFIAARLGISPADTRARVYAALLLAAGPAAVAPHMADLYAGAMTRSNMLDELRQGLRLLEQGFPTGIR